MGDKIVLSRGVCAERKCSEVIELLDNSDLPLWIFDKNEMVCGTVSDLELRLGFLAGLTLETPIVKFIRKTQPALITAQNVINNLSVNNAVPNESSQKTPIIDALIMAGGFGRRLGDITKETPKPLLKIGNQHIVDFALESLNDARFSQIYMSICYLSEQFERFVAEKKTDQNIELILEQEPLGTAGAIALIPNKKTNHLLVMNADILSKAKLSKVCDFHFHFESDMTLVVAPYETKVPYGVAKYSEDGSFLEMQEKPHFTSHVLAGIYLLSPKARQLLDDSEKIDMPDLIEKAKTIGLPIKVYPLFESWIDVGDLKSLEEARKGFESPIEVKPA